MLTVRQFLALSRTGLLPARQRCLYAAHARLRYQISCGLQWHVDAGGHGRGRISTPLVPVVCALLACGIYKFRNARLSCLSKNEFSLAKKYYLDAWERHLNTTSGIHIQDTGREHWSVSKKLNPFGGQQRDKADLSTGRIRFCASG